MRIDHGDYRIESNGLEITLSKRRLVKDGKKAGSEATSTIGHFNSLEAFLIRFSELLTFDGKSESFDELLSELMEIRKDIRKIGMDIGSNYSPLGGWERELRTRPWDSFSARR